MVFSVLNAHIQPYGFVCVKGQEVGCSNRVPFMTSPGSLLFS